MSQRVLSPHVSIIIPTYNRGLFIVETLESVFVQRYQDYEVIVVNDGSTDNTEELLRPYLDRIHLVKQQNSGVATARNRGLELAKGELLCFLDSDDIWRPGKLEMQVAFSEAHPEYGLVCTDIQGFDLTHAVERLKARTYAISNGMVLDNLLRGNWIQTSTVMLRRECLDRVGNFDENVGQFGEDWLLWMRVAAEFPVWFMPEPLVRYRCHPESLTFFQLEAQYSSLLLILKRLALLPQFQDRRWMLEEAAYRISFGRARDKWRAGAFSEAVDKLRDACRNRRHAFHAGALLLIAELANTLLEDRGATESFWRNLLF